MSTTDLNNLFKTINDAVNRIDSSEEATMPTIKVHQPITVNIDNSTMSRAEKAQVLDAVRSIVSRLQNENTQKTEVVEGDYKEINDIDRQQ